MNIKYTLSGLLILVLSGCAGQETINRSGVGKFVYVGPVSVQATVLSMKWRYGFRFSVDPVSVTGASLSCGAIPGTKFVINSKDLNIKETGLAFWDGPVMPVSQSSTPWLYESDTTESVCKAIISIKNSPDVTEEVPITFSKNTKAALLQQMKEAHEYNKRLKK